MPVLNITILEGRTEAQKQALVSALTNAVHESLGSPVSDVRIFVNEVSPSNFAAGGVLRSRAVKAQAKTLAQEQ
jgi:4-oxalocrotonate tautomerase